MPEHSRVTISSLLLGRFPKWVNPLSPNSDEKEISLYIITTWSNIQGMRIKEVITKRYGWCLDIKQIVLTRKDEKKCMENRKENIHVHIQGLKG